MTPEENPEYLQHLTEWVTEFQHKFEEFLTLHVENTGINAIGLGIAPAVIPKDGADPERIRVLAGELNVLAGRAKDACPITRMAYVVQGAGNIDPIVSWESVTRPKPLLEPQDVLGLCNQVRGRLEGMIERAKALEAPAIDTSRMHPLIWSAARSLWASGHPKQAVAAAAEALIGQVKARLDPNDIPETALWQ